MNAYTAISNALSSLCEQDALFTLVPAENPLHGDFATNIAFALSKKKGITPLVCAEELAAGLQNELGDVVAKIEVAGTGFINFFVREDIVRKENESEDTFVITKYTHKSVLVEHSSPNLFKPYSVGHLMNNTIGEFIARSMRYTGASVSVVSFPSDISLGIAKALMIVESDIKHHKVSLSFFDKSVDVVIEYLGEAYIRGVKLCEEDEGAMAEAKAVLARLYAHSSGSVDASDEEFSYLIEKTRSINESYFKSTLEGIGSHIDRFIYEGEAGQVGEAIVKEYTAAGKVFTSSEGAVVYIPDESRKDLHTAVFINSQGFPTYEAKDVGLLAIKFGMYAPDISFTVTDAEQLSHFKIVFDAAEKLNHEWSSRVSRSVHVPHGRMLFKGAKMSSRLGGVPLALEVISAVEDEVKERSGERIAHLGDAARAKLEREIALSALRIAVLRSKPGVNINFDPETSLSFEGDSGPYLLYTHARCCSLLAKGEASGVAPLFGDIPTTPLEHDLALFSIIMKEGIESFHPQKVVSYLFRIAQGFNSFYAENQIVSDDVVLSAHRLMIVRRTRFVLNEALSILGIVAPEEM